MSGQIEFYTNPMSRGRIVRWMLEEIAQPYTTHLLDYGAPMKAPDYLAINPMGKVPAIRHGDMVVTECGAICAYLADAFPHANLAPPAGVLARGAYYRWMFFNAGPIEAASSNHALDVVVPDEKRGMVGYGRMSDVVDAIEGAVRDRAFLAGDRFSAADLYVSASLGWLTAFGVIEKRPALMSYIKRHHDRPAAIRAREIDDALVQKSSG